MLLCCLSKSHFCAAVNKHKLGLQTISTTTKKPCHWHFVYSYHSLDCYGNNNFNYGGPKWQLVYQMWLPFPCGQNSDWREALYVDFPSRLDFIICSNRQRFCSWNEPEEAAVLAEGATGQRPSWRWTGPLCPRGSLTHSSLVNWRTKRAIALKGSFWLPLSTSGNPHVRIETCMKYRLVIIFDSVQDYAGGGKQVITLQ